MITEVEFLDYVRIQQSGVTNMFDIKTVVSLSRNLTKEKCLEIMKDYPILYEQYLGEKDEN